MKRRLVTLVRAFTYKAWVALSVVLLVVALLCYVHSFWRQVGAEYNPNVVMANGSVDDSWSVWSYRDGVMFCHSWTRLKIPDGSAMAGQGVQRMIRIKEEERGRDRWPGFWSAPTGRFGLMWASRSSDNAERSTRHGQINIPWWLIFAVLGAQVALWGVPMARRWRAARARRRGHCARCGYDLRATPARCPECGEVPAPAARF